MQLLILCAWHCKHFSFFLYSLTGFRAGASGKGPAHQSRRCKSHRFDRWVWKIPLRRRWQPTPVSLPEKSHGQSGWLQSIGLQIVEYDWRDLVCMFSLTICKIFYVLSVDVGHHSEWMTIANVDVRYANRSSLLSIFFLFPPLFLASLCFCRYLQWPSYYIQLTFPSSLFHFFLSLLSFLLPSPPSPLLFSPSLRYIVKNN